MTAAAEPPNAKHKLAVRWLQLALALVLAVRLVTLGLYPLPDTSEARYGEIARVMRETGNWVTPQETPGTPFWAKPPLYAWLSAGSTYLFGVNEFALRLPSLLCGVGVLVLCGVWARALTRTPSPPTPLPQAGEGSSGAVDRSSLAASEGVGARGAGPQAGEGSSGALDRPSLAASEGVGGRGAGPQAGEGSSGALDRPSPTQWERGGGEGQSAALLSCLILATTGFFIGYGAVMTDPALGLCTAWMMVAFQRAVIDRCGHIIWRYGFFVAGGLAMLAKGPVALLYVVLPAAAWATWRGHWPQVWRGLPWVRGTLLGAAISVPWYIWAEVRTPGFLSYFLIGEHLLRYLQPGWTGDRYGTAHREPVGTIWAFLAAGLGLWSILLLAMLRPGRGWMSHARARWADDGRLFALLAVLLPMLVFTFASNVIWTYVLPMLTPLAVLLGSELARRSVDPGPWRRAVIAIASGSVALVCVGAIAWAPVRANGSSFAGPVSAWRGQQRIKPGELLYWGRRTPASLRFYTGGSVEPVPDLAQRLSGLLPGERVYVAIVPEQLQALQQTVASQPQPYELAVIGRVKHAAIVEVVRMLNLS